MMIMDLRPDMNLVTIHGLDPFLQIVKIQRLVRTYVVQSVAYSYQLTLQIVFVLEVREGLVIATLVQLSHHRMYRTL